MKLLENQWMQREFLQLGRAQEMSSYCETSHHHDPASNRQQLEQLRTFEQMIKQQMADIKSQIDSNF